MEDVSLFKCAQSLPAISFSILIHSPNFVNVSFSCTAYQREDFFFLGGIAERDRGGAEGNSLSHRQCDLTFCEN